MLFHNLADLIFYPVGAIGGNLGRASVLRPGMYCYPGGSSVLSVQSLKICTLNVPSSKII